MRNPLLDAWHDVMLSGKVETVRELLAEEVCFHSPVVWRAQQGREITARYLAAAARVFEGNGFHYVRELVDGPDMALEFVAVIDGVEINGIDLIHWNDFGRISDFKVMIRPWKGLEKMREKMQAMLVSMG
jgi:hypothetical protein